MARPRNGVANDQAPDVNEAAQVMLQALAANMGHAPRDELADVEKRFRRQRALVLQIRYKPTTGSGKQR